VDELKTQIGDDGELMDHSADGWMGKPKKKRPLRWRRPRRVMTRFLLLLPIVLITVAITSVMTLIATGYIDLNSFEWYRRLCIATMGNVRLAYLNDRYGVMSGSVFLVDEASGRMCPLAYNVGLPGNEAWSPDGKQILFDTEQLSPDGAGTQFHILKINADGTGLTTLASDDVRLPAWSPDGRSIMYWQGPNVFLMDADGQNKHLILRQGQFAAPSWSFNSQTIILNDENAQKILSMRLDGSESRTLTDGRQPQSSPDGKHILFTTGDFNYVTLHICDADGGNAHQLSTLPIPYPPITLWSPDSQKIAFSAQSDPAQPKSVALYVLTLDGSLPRALTHGGTPYVSGWSPDSQEIGYMLEAADRSRTVNVIRADGSQGRTLLSSSTQLLGGPVWNPVAGR